MDGIELDSFAQAPDECLAGCPGPPRRIRDKLASTPHEEDEDVELLLGEGYRSAASANCLKRKVDLQVASKVLATQGAEPLST